MKPSAGLERLLHGKKLLIFDFDGTIADTTPLHSAAFAEVLGPLGVKVNYPSIAGLATADAMRRCLTAAGMSLSDAELDALIAAKQQRVRQMVLQELQPLPGVDDFLCWAKLRYRLAMVTSGSRGTVSLSLAKLGYAEFFDPLVCSDDVARAKPNPEGFLKVLTVTGVPASEALVFEDSQAGFVASRAAGLAYVNVLSDPLRIPEESSH